MTKEDALRQRKQWLVTQLRNDAQANRVPMPSNARVDQAWALWQRARVVAGPFPGLTGLIAKYGAAPNARTLQHVAELERMGEAV